jgi:hypothetical protein
MAKEKQQTFEERQDQTGKTTLVRGFKLMNGEQVVAVGDHLIVEHNTGNSDDCFIFQEKGQPKVKRLQMQMVISTPSPAVPASSAFGATLVDVPAADEKRLLAIYRTFSK